MKLLNHYLRFDSSGRRAPWDEYGEAIPAEGYPFRDFPVGSRYTCILAGSEAFYIKTANNNAAADWVKIAYAGGSITGDLTVTGTLTAGDVVISP